MRRRMVPRWPGILAVACLAGGSLVACEGGTLLEGDVLDAPPDVFIDRTATSTQVNAGTAIRVLVRGEGRNSSGVESMDVSWTGAFNGSFRRVFEGAPLTVSLDTTISVPPTATGTVTLKATASSPSGLKSDPAMAVVTILAPDTTPPEVSVASVLPDRSEADDSVDVTIRCRDANEGGLLAWCGYTVLFYQAGGDTVTVARADTVMARDTALIHDVLPIQGFGTMDLPTDVTVEVHGYAVDAAGNCAANVREPFASLPCVAVGSRLLAEESAPANVTVVASTTIQRDWGGTIGDLVSDQKPRTPLCVRHGPQRGRGARLRRRARPGAEEGYPGRIPAIRHHRGPYRRHAHCGEFRRRKPVIRRPESANREDAAFGNSRMRRSTTLPAQCGRRR